MHLEKLMPHTIKTLMATALISYAFVEAVNVAHSDEVFEKWGVREVVSSEFCLAAFEEGQILQSERSARQNSFISFLHHAEKFYFFTFNHERYQCLRVAP